MKVLDDIIGIDFDGFIIDYRLEYHITGEVVNCKPLIFDLPINGQKLILGKNSEQKKAQIQAFKALFSLILPLGIHDQNTFFKNELSPVYSKINTLLAQEQIKVSDLYKYSEEGSVAYAIHSSYSKPENYTKDFHKIWENAKELIINRNSRIKANPLRFIGVNYPEFGFIIIPPLIPFLKNSSIKRVAYESLGSFVTKDSLNYLLKELETAKDSEVLRGIFGALSKHRLKDLKIQDALIKTYKATNDLSESAKENLMEVLKYYPNKRSIEIGLDIINQNKRSSSRRAANILLNMGYPAKKIAEIAVPRLFTYDPKESEASFAILSAPSFSEYLPTKRELLKIYIDTLEVNHNSTIVYSMCNMMRNNFNYATSEDIVTCLSHPNPNVLEGILVLINTLMNHTGIESAPFYGQKAKESYYSLLQHEKEKVVRDTLTILQRIGLKEGKKEYIDLFLDLIDFNKNSLNNLHAMMAINHILPAVKFNEQIIKHYLKALESTNYNYRVAALKGLRFSDDKELKKSLSYLENDPAKEVRRAFENLHKPPARIKKTTRLAINFLKYAFSRILK